MREIWFAMVVALALAGACPAVAQAPNPVDAGALVVSEQDHVLGQPDAPITIVEYASLDRKSTRLNSSHIQKSRMPSSA